MNRRLSPLGLGILLLATASPAGDLAGRDRRYLKGVYRDTWACLAHFVGEGSGLPYDSARRLPSTSLTNIGLYLAATAVAARTGLLTDDEARARLDRALTSLVKIERWGYGFPVTWVNVDTLEPTENQFSTVDHLSHLVGGLLVVKGLFPEYAPTVDDVLQPMDWGGLYDPARRWLKGGWRRDRKDFDVRQKGWDWYYSYVGADTRFGYVYGIGRGQIPPESWSALNHDREKKHGLSYFVPGWQGGGLFMQMVSGLFVDEKPSALGRSAADFAWAQTLHARSLGSPVWGWSACESPDGKSYLGWGHIDDAVVTPHAAALAAVFYPRQATENLRRLEKMGVRAPWDGGADGRRPFGFRDSLNWKTGEVSGNYLGLDQGMLFLALANTLHDGIVWKAVAQDPTVRRGVEAISDFAGDPASPAEYRRRDAEPFLLPPAGR